jgi:hypothetical protein
MLTFDVPAESDQFYKTRAESLAAPRRRSKPPPSALLDVINRILPFPQFLTTYIVSLMKSIDIRSEPAVRLLADFLDERGSTGRDRRGAEQFSHGTSSSNALFGVKLIRDAAEVYSFLRSPYRDLALYDAIAQVGQME